MVVGGGPAGLMAAERLAAAGAEVRSLRRDALGGPQVPAGRQGRAEPHALRSASTPSSRAMARAAPKSSRCCAASARRPCATGRRVWASTPSSAVPGASSPSDMKAAPLLRAWLHRLREAGRAASTCGIAGIGFADAAHDLPALRFDTPQGETVVQADAVVLALGGASWARLGSDGAWVPWLQWRGVEVAPLRPSNCGFDVAGAEQRGGAGWSEHFSSRHAGEPLKSVAIELRDAAGTPWRQLASSSSRDYGVEGSLVYAASARLRDAIDARRPGHAVTWTCCRHAAWTGCCAELAHPRGSRSLSTHLKTRLGLDGRQGRRCCTSCWTRRRWPTRPQLAARRSRRCRWCCARRGPSTRPSAAPAACASRRWTTA